MKSLPPHIKRILLVSPRGVGGIQNWCVRYALELKEAFDLRADILYEDYGFTGIETGKNPAAEDIKTISFTYEPTDNRSMVCRKLEEIIRGYDLVYPTTSGLTCQAIASLGTARPITIGAVRGDFAHDYGINARFYSYLDHIFSVSELCREGLRAHLPPEAPAVSVIPHSATVGTPAQEIDGPLRILFTGRFDPVKRLGDVVSVAAELKQRGIEFSMTLAGDGPDRVNVESFINEQSLGDRIELTGFLDRGDIRNLLARAHALLLLSERESFGLSALEAMAFGAIPIVTNTSGCRQAIRHNENGFLVSPGEPAKVAGHLTALNADRELWQRLSTAARETVRDEYSRELEIERHVDAIHQATEFHREHAPLTKPMPRQFSRLDKPYIPNWLTRTLRGLRT